MPHQRIDVGATRHDFASVGDVLCVATPAQSVLEASLRTECVNVSEPELSLLENVEAVCC